MRLYRNLVRPTLLAALIFNPNSVAADISAAYNRIAGTLTVSGLDRDELDLIGAQPDRLRLQVVDSKAKSSMLLTLSRQAGGLTIKPRFALRAGTKYLMRVNLPDGSLQAQVDVPASNANIPRLERFYPSQAIIPANTLRMYLQFSEPMARGHLLNSVTLLSRDGIEVEKPFLSLETELWDASQTRATLLFDPGRLKEAVGPNIKAGTPLRAGESYRLVVSERMQSAEGVPLAGKVEMSFRVGPGEHGKIAPEAWQVMIPQAGSSAVLSVGFDRVIDRFAALRHLSLHDENGARVKGQADSDGGGWTFSPSMPWPEGTFVLRVAPALEDVSGNTIGHPFDAPEGTMGSADKAATVRVEIKPK